MPQLARICCARKSLVQLRWWWEPTDCAVLSPAGDSANKKQLVSKIVYKHHDFGMIKHSRNRH
jgi:hypothetical protein